MRPGRRGSRMRSMCGVARPLSPPNRNSVEAKSSPAVIAVKCSISSFFLLFQDLFCFSSPVSPSRPANFRSGDKGIESWLRRDKLDLRLKPTIDNEIPLVQDLGDFHFTSTPDVAAVIGALALSAPPVDVFPYFINLPYLLRCKDLF